MAAVAGIAVTEKAICGFLSIIMTTIAEADEKILRLRSFFAGHGAVVLLWDNSGGTMACLQQENNSGSVVESLRPKRCR